MTKNTNISHFQAEIANLNCSNPALNFMILLWVMAVLIPTVIPISNCLDPTDDLPNALFFNSSPAPIVCHSENFWSFNHTIQDNA